MPNRSVYAIACRPEDKFKYKIDLGWPACPQCVMVFAQRVRWVFFLESYYCVGKNHATARLRQLAHTAKR